MKKLIVLVMLLFSFALVSQAKTLKLAMESDPVSLDPYVELSEDMLQYNNLVFDPLVRWTKNMQIEPRLAVKWQRISPTELRFFLRKGVKFHSGNPFTAKDVAWTVDRAKKSEDFKAIFDPIVSVKVIDDYTVDLVTKTPYPLMMNVATYLFPMDSKFYTGKDSKGLAKDAIVKTDYSFANLHESGTGKYIVKEREQGVKLVLQQYKGYWNKAGNVDNIVITPIKNDATRVAALLSGDVDMIMPVPPQDYDRVKSKSGIQMITMGGARIITLQLNEKRVKAFKDKRVREAFIYAINNQGIVDKIMKGTAVAAEQQSPKSYLGHVDGLKPRFDLKKAQELMKQAGYAKGFTVSMIAPNNRYIHDEEISQAVVAMLGKINVKVNLKTMPKAQYWDQFEAQVADIQMVGWYPDTNDSGNYTEFLLMCPNKKTGYGQYNSGNYCNPKLDQVALAAQKETNNAKRKALLQSAEKLAYADAAFVPLHWESLSWAGKSNMNLSSVVNIMNFPYLGDLVIK